MINAGAQIGDAAAPRPRGVESTAMDSGASGHGAPFPRSSIPAANVAAVPQRSPLRYPGGKTWLIPHIRAWLARNETPPELIVEPFAGGGTVSLTAVMENLVRRATMMELDEDIAAFWEAALRHGPALSARVQAFRPTKEDINRLESRPMRNVVEHGFRTLVLNRTRRGGVLAPGAALTRNGENGNGLASRWYPETLRKRLTAIGLAAQCITFRQGDGVELLEKMAASRADARFFIDPPYTANGGKRAGTRLYAHSTIEHSRVFDILASSGADFLMTYDCSEEIVSLVQRHGFNAVIVMMKNGHHAVLPELVITRDAIFA